MIQLRKDISDIVKRWESIEYQNAMKSLYGEYYVCDILAKFSRYPNSGNQVDYSNLPNDLKLSIQYSANFIFENRLALAISPEDWGHGHFIIDSVTQSKISSVLSASLSYIEKAKTITNFVMRKWRAILWHTQEFYDSSIPNYPLKYSKRNICIERLTMQPYVVITPDVGKSKTVSSDEFAKSKRLVNSFQFEIRIHDAQDTIDTPFGPVYLWVPKLLYFNRNK